ncbi:hypothetical protein [Blautia massiliensis (ex Durand et al. 2017)]|uniref:hypothetical protein n=1 Tax=Blautia massiliensis (ex Durand et al. 2017) TaxID=1737424 RepID=UPI00189E8F25|nr:hypothetical protein [Blautia massiliensis (ex Durand et al. 2017)]
MLGKNITKRKKIFAFVCIVIFVGEAILFMLNAATDYKIYTDSEIVKANVINVSDTKSGMLNVKYRYNYDSNKYEKSAKYECEARVIKAGDEKKIRIRKNTPEQIITTSIKTAVMHDIAFALCLFAYVAASTENRESPAAQSQRFRF